MAEEAVSEKDWSLQDQQWLARVPVQIRHLCLKHGREVSQWVIDSGNAAHALNLMARMLPGNRAATKAVMVLQQVLNNRTLELIRARMGGDAGVQRFVEIKEEFDLALALQDSGQAADGKARSPGGIILDS